MMADNHRLPTPTDRALLRALESHWDEYRHALHPADQTVFDRLIEHAKAHTDEYAHSEVQNSHFTEQVNDYTALVSILIEQQKQLDDLEDRLDYLEADLNDGG
jgi:hypothetical protein